MVERLFTCSGQPSVCSNWCGDSKLKTDVGEVCDNGNSTVDDGCFNNCTVNPKWSCVNSNNKKSNCTAICGDGFIVGSEIASNKCDDGNNIRYDGCYQCNVESYYECSGEPSICNPICGDGRLIAI